MRLIITRLSSKVCVVMTVFLANRLREPRTMSNAVGIIDEPVAPGATDNLDINIHSKSLVDFISDTSTPITVGIQGEWGSGKTSLINSIHHSFDSHGDITNLINSWEYSYCLLRKAL